MSQMYFSDISKIYSAGCSKNTFSQWNYAILNFPSKFVTPQQCKPHHQNKNF